MKRISLYFCWRCRDATFFFSSSLKCVLKSSASVSSQSSSHCATSSFSSFSLVHSAVRVKIRVERERERSFGHSLAERARERKATRHRKSFQKRLSRRLILLFFDDDEIQFSPMTKKTNGTHLLLRTPRTRRRTLSPPALSSSVCSRGVVVVSLGVGRFWSEEAS